MHKWKQNKMAPSKQEKLGYSSYDEHDYGTAWWAERATDKAHQKAYQKIAKYIHKHSTIEDPHIIDFACGPGFLIKHLSEQMPQAQIIGIDESKQAIKAAKKYHKIAIPDAARQQVTMQQMALPNFKHNLPQADIVIFSFPDFRADEEKKWIKHWSKHFADDHAEAKFLRRKHKKFYDDSDHSPVSELFIKRIAGRNIIDMCKPGGLIFRVEYSACKRGDCEEGFMEEMHFWECIKPLDKAFARKERKELVFAKKLRSKFYRSDVIHDVYAQTGDDDDLDGGFFITAYERCK